MSKCWLCDSEVEIPENCALYVPECPLFGIDKMIEPLDLLKKVGELETKTVEADARAYKLEAEFNAANEKLSAAKDEHHTMQELYDHRHALFLALLCEYSEPSKTWKSRKHSDGTMYDDWFIAGIILPVGPISYHMPIELWDYCLAIEIPEAPVWDGYTPEDVVTRLMGLVGKPLPTPSEVGDTQVTEDK